jgi:hypothetical protein
MVVAQGGAMVGIVEEVSGRVSRRSSRIGMHIHEEENRDRTAMILHSVLAVAW